MIPFNTMAFLNFVLFYYDNTNNLEDSHSYASLIALSDLKSIRRQGPKTSKALGALKY